MFLITVRPYESGIIEIYDNRGNSEMFCNEDVPDAVELFIKHNYNDDDCYTVDVEDIHRSLD